MRLGKLASRLARNEGFCPCVYVQYSATGPYYAMAIYVLSSYVVSVIARPVTLPRSPQRQPRINADFPRRNDILYCTLRQVGL